jgi:LPS-assembly protein
MRFYNLLKSVFLIGVLFLSVAQAQQTNPVDRDVSNPLTDTPNINPIAPEKDIKAPKKKPELDNKPKIAEDEVEVISDRQTVEGAEGKRVVIHSGNVDVHYGNYRLQADKITYYETEGRFVAEGSVVFDQGDDQRLTGTKGEFNIRTKLGHFENSTGFTNQTNDGTVVYFTADRVERTGENEVLVENGKFTACEEIVPKWSFTADRQNYVL